MSSVLDFVGRFVGIGWGLNFLAIVWVLAYENIRGRYESDRDTLPLLLLLAASWIPFLVFMAIIFSLLGRKR